MAGIYIHIPFCKQACHYCDFHFSTQMGKKEAMVHALCRELELRAHELGQDVVETIYFGGGTPSVLELQELELLIATVHKHYRVSADAELTLEANPDDLSKDRMAALHQSPVNRLSIGIQSFYDEHLKLMNRAHNGAEAKYALTEALHHFDNISIDLIYAVPGMTMAQWEDNIATALQFGIPHISSYALTVEPKTALSDFVAKGLVPAVADEVAQQHFERLTERLEVVGYSGYEISNFGKPGYFSKNNTAYWQQKPYLGIGPSAHSYNGMERSWNVNNNPKYIRALEEGRVPREKEVLTTTDKYNEYVMTGLRTIWGVGLEKVRKQYGGVYAAYLETHARPYVEERLLYWDGDVLLATKKGRFLADGIASALFMLNLK